MCTEHLPQEQGSPPSVCVCAFLPLISTRSPEVTSRGVAYISEPTMPVRF